MGPGIDLLGGMDGCPPPGPDKLAGASGRADFAALAGGDASAQAQLGDAATCSRALWGPQELGGGPRCRGAVGPLGWSVLAPEKAERLVEEARSSVGVRVGEWQRRQIKEYAREALIARQQIKGAERRLRELAVGNKVLEAQGNAVGIATACVLWTCVGDPRKYHAAAAYRKAMGLNLKERSSGDYQGQLRISKRGSARDSEMALFCRAAAGATQRGASLVRSQEGT